VARFDYTGQPGQRVDPGLSPNPTTPIFVQTKGGRRATRTLEQFTVTSEMLGEGASELLLKVDAAEGLEFSYELAITAIPPCSAIDDEYEDNDTVATARALAPGDHQLHLCEEDEDWYTLPVELGDTFFVDVQANEDLENKTAPKIAVEIRSPSGRLITTGRSESGVITAGAWDLFEQGDYQIRVRGEDAEQQGPYAMQIYQYAPCPAGDDRYEDNDAPSAPAVLDPQMPMHRYLRLCPEEADYYKLVLPDPDAKKKQAAQFKPGQNAPVPTAPGPATQDDPDAKPKPRKLALGLTIVRPPEGSPSAELDAEQEGVLAFDWLSPSGDQILLESITPPPTPPVPELPKDAAPDAPNPIALDRILQKDDVEATEALVRVQGRPLFYHIVQLNPQKAPNPQQDQNEDQQQKEDSEEENGEDEEEQDDAEDPENAEDQPPEDESDPDGQDDAEEDPEEPDEQEGQANPDEEPKEEQAEQKKAADSGEEEPEEDPEARRLQDILRALEETDDNFQMRKALENTPRRYIEKDW